MKVGLQINTFTWPGAPETIGPTLARVVREADDIGPEHQPWVEGKVGRQHLSRRNDYGQAGERYRTMPDEERE